MPVTLLPGLQRLLREPAHCQVATLMPDGSPQITQVWVDTDGEHILVNTFEGSQKTRNVSRDPRVAVNVVDPGWVPTRMGGPGAPDDLELGYRTQTWLAVSDEPDARTSGGYWYHRQRTTPARAALDADFQDALLRDLHRVTGVELV
jgi:hypothetical protein